VHSGPDVIWNYGNINDDGLQPHAALITDEKGNLYGTTLAGGANNDGAIVELVDQPSGKYSEKVLWSFSNLYDGGNPQGSLLLVNGKLYGTAATGGAYHFGTVFELNPSKPKKINVLHSFNGVGYGDGATPMAGLAAYNGALYGTTEYGGLDMCGSSGHGCGTIFECKIAAGTCRTIWAFHGGSVNDGAFPLSSVIVANGAVAACTVPCLAGTTSQGGPYGCPTLPEHCGTLFIAHPQSSGWTEAAYHGFGAGSDGVYPTSAVVYNAGVFAGTTEYGGITRSGSNLGYGAVFTFSQPSKSASEVVLHSFNPTSNDDGGYPLGDVILDSKHGELYGTTNAGGKNAGGAAYKVDLSGRHEIVFWSYKKSAGLYPAAGFLIGAGVNAKSLFGTTVGGGSKGNGVANVFHNELP
jgi:uncharacterized repeat protein (TIGR03803 family)